MVKIGLSYTGFTPSLMNIVESAIREALPGETVNFVTMANPLLIEETVAAGAVTSAVARGLMRAYMELIDAGVDLIVNVCSTMGDLAETVKPLMAAMAMPFIRIDEEMFRQALTSYNRVAVIYASRPVMGPNRTLAEKVAAETGSSASVSHILLEGASGTAPAQFIDKVAAAVLAIESTPDVVVLTQTSMAPVVPELRSALGIPVLSSSPFAGSVVAETVAAMKKEGKLQ